MAERDISFGFLLPTREVVMAQDIPDCHQIIDLAERAEAFGFDSVWAGDSILARPRLEALTTLAAVAARTQRVKLGTAVFLSALRHPVTLANETANLDLLSAGRLILGLGIATKSKPVQQEFTACGIDFSRRISIFEEGVSVMRRLWTEPSVTFDGRYFQLQDVRLGLHPVQPSGIPVWLAGSVDAAYRRILRLADGWFPNPASPQAFTAGWERIQSLAQEVGRDSRNLHRCVYTTLNINDNVTQAEDEMKAFIEGYYGVAYETMVGRQSMCAGTAAHCVAWLNDFIAAGAQSVVIRFGAPDQIGQLERCARDILPHVRRY